ncbi:hypothetical protein GCM10010116_41070 [Microbispora rosea subsp. aerata]|nr:hypothetical protein GCM10010116_41070 [Microbispora rosea subsp. aerata]GIH57157.1 hypothetical protein Mro02_40710 [Microbispora rosea subsp. aerata]GLJ84773.1 hypothetical protein GCM10017588_35010 [Microbispora rosea subsp. aerata]
MPKDSTAPLPPSGENKQLEARIRELHLDGPEIWAQVVYARDHERAGDRRRRAGPSVRP